MCERRRLLSSSMFSLSPSSILLDLRTLHDAFFTQSSLLCGKLEDMRLEVTGGSRWTFVVRCGCARWLHEGRFDKENNPDNLFR